MREKKPVCKETMQALFDSSHTHTCTGNHKDGDHYCGECQRYWYSAKAKEAS